MLFIRLTKFVQFLRAFNIVERRRRLNAERAADATARHAAYRAELEADRQAEIAAAADAAALAHEREMAFTKQLVEAHLAALAAQSTAFQAVIAPLVDAANEQADVLKTWLRMFQTSAPPTTSVVREADETLNAARRGALAGIPPEFQLAYVLQQSADPLS
jgi:hypothetical protein